MLNTYSEEFAISKEINIPSLPLKFEGFHFDPKTDRMLGITTKITLKLAHFSKRLVIKG
ncbi:MAG: hypothetical protein MRERC_2c082 [Mycoplasmataceae bacterium RC_NB112A]|nr:MAG: hypothetical protein MRERC_2c082 [Mycoplasmataceae bacterium RC_NB112A]